MKKILFIFILISNISFGQSPMLGLVSNSSEAAPTGIPFAILSYNISQETSTTARVQCYMTEQCSINYRVDGVLNAVSSDDFDAGVIGINEFVHTRTLIGLTPDHTGNLIIELTAQDDAEVIQSGNIPLTTLPSAPIGDPILSNFRVDDANKSIVLFDSTTDLTGLTKTGFIIQDRLINSLTIDGDKLGGYLTIDTAFDFWDNNTIRLESGNGIVNDFTLQHIKNNINEPTSSGTPYYVKVGGSNLADGLSESTAWGTLAYASGQLSNGDILYVKAGAYGSDGFTLTASGTEANPIRVIGYETTINDDPELIRSVGMTFNSAVLPLIDGDNFDFNTADYVIVKNFQVDPNSTAIDGYDLDSSDNVYMRNVYVEEAKNGFFSLRSTSISNLRLERVFAQNCGSTGMVLGVTNGLIDDAYVCSSYVKNMDYYIALLGTSGGGHSIVKDSYVKRFITDSHPGHGIAIKSDEDNTYGYTLEYMLVDNCDIIDVGQSLEFKHHGTRYSVARDVRVDWQGNDNNTYLGIHLQGSSHNTIENCTFEAEYGIRWGSSVEDLLMTDTGNNNLFRNCIWKNSHNLHKYWQVNEDQGGPDNIAPNNNKFLNCTIERATVQLFFNGFSSGTSVGNEVTNCIIQNTATKQSTGAALGFTFTYSDLYNSFTDGGTGNFDVNPILTASYQPTATFTTVDVNRLSNVLYDINGLERNATLTTVGAVLHANEAP